MSKRDEDKGGCLLGIMSLVIPAGVVILVAALNGPRNDLKCPADHAPVLSTNFKWVCAKVVTDENRKG